jgi:hypothetical protein
MKAKILMVAILTAFSGAAAAQTADPGQEVLHDGFDGKDFSPDGHLYYRDNAEQRAGSYEFQSDVTFSGSGALKLSVKPLCAEGKKNCSERAEIWERTKHRVPYDQGVWYGFAVKFGDPIPSGDHRYLIAQWKREIGPNAQGDFSPFLALRLNNGKLFATVETNYVAPPKGAANSKTTSCGEGKTPVWYRPDTNQMRALLATDADWTPEDGAGFKDCTDAITITDHGLRLDRLRDLHAARPRWLRPDRDLRQRQMDRHRKGTYRPCGQGSREKPVFQVRPLSRRRHDRLDHVLRRFPPLAELRRRAEGSKSLPCKINLSGSQM